MAAKFSLGEEALECLHAEHPSWSTPSPTTYKLRGDAWDCIAYFEGCMDKVSLSWLSLLAMPGHLLHHPTLLPRGAWYMGRGQHPGQFAQGESQEVMSQNPPPPLSHQVHWCSTLRCSA